MSTHRKRQPYEGPKGFDLATDDRLADLARRYREEARGDDPARATYAMAVLREIRAERTRRAAGRRAA